MTNTQAFLLNGAKKVQVGAAALAVVAAAAITPVMVPMVSHAAPLVSAAPVLTWGFDEVDAALIIGDNDNKDTGAAVAPSAAVIGGSAVGASQTPIELIGYLIQGIADGISDIARAVVDIAGTTVYVAIAFTGGVITTVGDFLPGPVGNLLVNVGTTVNNVANAVAEALKVGPYATATV